MPVYNAEKYVGEAIQSVLQQDFWNFVFIIIDDGSVDHSASIVRSFSDTRIRFFQNHQNVGLVETLNRGIALSQGTYIARMDADDVSLPNRLGLQYDFLERHQSIAVCGSAVDVMGTNELWIQPQDPDEVKCELLFRCCIAHPTVMIRREVFNDPACRYQHNFQHAEDYDLWVRLSRRVKLANLRVPLLRYRLHPNQITNVHAVHQLKLVREIHRRQLSDLGIVATDTQLDIHFNPWSYCGTDMLHHWFETLLTANQVRGVYKQSVLEAVLARYCPH